MISKSLQQMFAARNRESHDCWSEFAEHREHLRNLLEEHAQPQDRTLCILGAGNANDLDLKWLTSRFEKVTLVDLDRTAMQSGVTRQLGLLPEHIELLECDVTGLSNVLEEQTTGTKLHPDFIESIALRLEATFLPDLLKSKYDVVASTCLLSQLIDTIRIAVGESHPHFLTLVQGVRRQHCQTLVQICRKQGLVACVFDFVSSVTCPGLNDLPSTELAAYAAKQINAQNFFTGLHPAFMRKSLLEAFNAEAQSSACHMTPPWRWNLGSRTYLVSAVLARLV